MKKVILCVVVLALVLISSGCAIKGSSDNVMEKKTEKQMKEINAQVGLPAIKNFQEKKLAKQIFELRDREDLVTYAYIVNHMTGELVFIGKCLGFGLPYSVQYTNPMKKEWSDASPIPQADPNGLFMPDGLSATWLMILDNKGEPHPVYVEPAIIVSPFPLYN